MHRLLLVLFVLLAACAQQPPRDDSLYRALGAQDGLTRIVESTLLNAVQDPRIARHFLNVDIERLRDKLIEQLCFESGGPCSYTGDSMEESHKGQNLKPADFNALVESLQDAMDSEGVGTPAQNRLLARLAPMRGQVIDR